MIPLAKPYHKVVEASPRLSDEAIGEVTDYLRNHFPMRNVDGQDMVLAHSDWETVQIDLLYPNTQEYECQ